MKKNIHVIFICLILLIEMNIASSTNLSDEKITNTKKIYSPNILLDEDFSGSFPPAGWSTDYWTQCNESCMSEPPCACLYSEELTDTNFSYITSRAVDTKNVVVNLRNLYDSTHLHFLGI